jgi:predicted NUDIX family NTP pyrophosphohydrolase
MAVHSAGILLHRRKGPVREVFLVHPGGPFWHNKDAAAWSIPKGLIAPGEDGLAAAKREFEEETGFAVDGDFRALGTFRQPSGKDISVWSLEGDCDAAAIASNGFALEWPPHSGHMQDFPEVDRAAWFGRADALYRIHRGQRPILDAFYAKLNARAPGRAAVAAARSGR